MGRRWLLTTFLLVLTAQTGFADLTIHSTVEFQFAPYLPPQVRTQLQQQVTGAFSGDSVLRLKGDKCYNNRMLTSIVDYGRNEVTVFNPQTRQYATVPISEYADRFGALQKAPVLPPGAQDMLQRLKIDVETKKTGQTAAIQGVRTEESLITISMQLPDPQAAASALRMEMSFWAAQADEIRRVPALQELADYSARSKRTFDPVDMIQKLFTALPGMSDQLRSSLAALTQADSGFPLKFEMRVYIPAMTQALQLAPQQPAGVDFSAPFIAMTMNLTSISNDPIPDSQFAVPQNYQAVSFEQLAQSLIPAPPRVPAAAPKQ